MADSYELIFDYLGYEGEVDGQIQRCEIEGRGNIFKGSDLDPACLARGLETGALVKVSGKKDKPAEPAAPATAEAEEITWPSTHKELDALAAKAGITFPKKTNVATKVELLKAALAAKAPLDADPPAEDGEGEGDDGEPPADPPADE